MNKHVNKLKQQQKQKQKQKTKKIADSLIKHNTGP